MLPLPEALSPVAVEAVEPVKLKAGSVIVARQENVARQLCRLDAGVDPAYESRARNGAVGGPEAVLTLEERRASGLAETKRLALAHQGKGAFCRPVATPCLAVGATGRLVDAGLVDQTVLKRHNFERTGRFTGLDLRMDRWLAH